MTTKKKPGPPPRPDFADMGNISDELKEYLMQVDLYLIELSQRVDALENAS